MSEFWTHLVFALLGGILPALFWVWFWNKEDRLHPEPRRVLALVFVAGMVSVFFAVLLEATVEKYLSPQQRWQQMIYFVAIEELLKFLFAYFVILRNRKIADEPIDMVIYMLTVAFGFSAAENVLFLLKDAGASGILAGLSTGNLRFIGATLLHALSSALVGVFMAFAFYKSKFTKLLAIGAGLIAAFVVHYIFNILLIYKVMSNVLQIFAFVWVGLVILMILLEKIKKINTQSKY